MIIGLIQSSTHRPEIWLVTYVIDIESQLIWVTRDITRTISFSLVQPNIRISTWSWAHQDVPIFLVKGDPGCSALEESAKFHFEDSDEERKSNSGYLVENCLIILRSFIQKVSYKAVSIDSPPMKCQDGDWSYAGLLATTVHGGSTNSH